MKSEPINLNIIGKGSEVEKLQKRLRCAARATGTELHLSSQHEHPQAPGIAENSVPSPAKTNWYSMDLEAPKKLKLY